MPDNDTGQLSPEGSKELYRETQLFPNFVLAILLFVPLVMIFGRAPIFALLFICAILGTVFILFGKFYLIVNANGILLYFGKFKVFKRFIPFSEIESKRIVSYRPIMQFGGWGLRIGRFEGLATVAYSMRGNRGVLLTLKNKKKFFLATTDRILLGTEKPEELSASLPV